MNIDQLSIFVGYDSKEDIAYRVCKYSILENTSFNVKIRSLKLQELIAKKMYTRAVDPLASTSRILDPRIIGDHHYNVARNVQSVLQKYIDFQYFPMLSKTM